MANGFGRAGYVVVVLGVTQRRLLDFEQPSLRNVLIHNMFRSTAGTVLGTGQILELIRFLRIDYVFSGG